MQLISTFYENNNTRARAEVVKEDRGYSIHFHNANGDLFKTESFEGKSLQYVENAAENWAFSIKTLNE